MQWLINIIKEIVHGQLGYFDRGDPFAADFHADDFTIDNAWHDLDLSPIVPAGARAVLFHVKASCTYAARPIRFRKKGNVELFNTSIFGTANANQSHWEDLICACDDDRFVQYQIAVNPAWLIEITVAGWWL